MVLIFGVIALAVAVAVVVALAGTMGLGATGVARSLELINHRPSAHDVARVELSARDRLVVPFEGALKSLARRLSPAGAADRLSAHLDRAGNPAGWSVERIFALKGVGLFVGALAGLLLRGWSVAGLLWAVVGAAGLFWLPDLLLYNLGLRRQDQLRRGFADALDMLTVCVEAGQGFDAALAQVARTVPGPIGGEFSRVLSEVQIGMSRSDAFAALAQRNPIAEVKTFTSALMQADRLGVPIGGVLREQTREMRVVRRQRAEEQAQKVTVKVVFPVLLCIFPVIFIVILGPAAISLFRMFHRGG